MTSEELGIAIGRIGGNIIMGICIYQLGGWLWVGVVYGAIAAAPMWWFFRK